MNAEDPYLRSSLREPMPEPDTKLYSEEEVNAAIIEALAETHYAQQTEPLEPLNRPLPPWLASRAHLKPLRHYL